jgi:hypothetical protein
MQKLRSLLYHAFVIIGYTLLISKLASKAFGLKETLTSHMGLLISYELTILTTVSLVYYWYKRHKAQKDAGHNTPYAVTKKDIPPHCREKISDIRQTLRKPAVILRSTPVEQLPEGHVSCLGRVTWQLPGEEWPVDDKGKRLEPLATLFVPDLPGVPTALSQVALITIFAPEEAWANNPDEMPRLGCVVRTYPSLDNLEPCNHISTVWNTCILTPEAVANDMPYGRCCGGGDEMWDKIVELEEKYPIEYEEHICNAAYRTYEVAQFPARHFTNPELHAIYETHKLGGYPTFIQDGGEIDDYPFVMQLSFDEAAGLEIADAGSYYFFYNAAENDWLVTSDSY